MPWTFAHPAAVLPLRRIGSLDLPMSCLVVGSLIPDLGYYIGRYDLAAFAHTMGGLAHFCVPAALFAVFLLTRFRSMLTAPLPQPHRAAFESLPDLELRSVSGALRMAIAVFAGVLTHIVWDSFTHSSGLAVRAISALRDELGTVSGRTFRVYNILQHVSTLLGVVALLVAYRRWFLGTSPVITQGSTGGPGKYWRLVACALASAAAGSAVSLLRAAGGTSASAIVVHAVTYASVAFTAGYIALGIRASRIS